MKKIFSSLISLLLMLIVPGGNTMMTFADEKIDMSMKMEMKSESGCSDEDKELYNHECCYESSETSGISALNNIREENKKIKVKIENSIDIFSFSFKSHEDKNLTKITSPPNKRRKIKNYSYIDLTRIIKSNT